MNGDGDGGSGRAGIAAFGLGDATGAVGLAIVAVVSSAPDDAGSGGFAARAGGEEARGSRSALRQCQVPMPTPKFW